MRQRIQKFHAISWGLLVSLVLGLFVTQYGSAASGQLYVSPGTKSAQKDSQFSLAVRINPGGTPVDVVEGINLTFDTSKLQYVSHSTAGSPFESQLSSSVTSGSVKISLATFGSAIGSDALIMNVTFKALAGSGSSTPQLSGNAASSSTGGYTNPTPSGATVSFTSPPTATPTTPTTPTTPSTPKPPANNSNKPTTNNNSSNSSNNNPSTPSSPSSQPTEVKPGQANVTSEKKTVGYHNASVELNSDKDARATIVYGIGDDLVFQTGQTELGKSHTLELDSKHLIPGTTYRYKTVLITADGVSTEGEIQTLKTKGYGLRVLVLGKDNAPLRNKSITIHSEPQTGKTDGDGTVVFNELAPGTHEVRYQDGDSTYKANVVVDDIAKTSTLGAQTAPVQNATVVFGEASSGPSPALLAWLSVAMVLVVAIVAGVLFRGRIAELIASRTNKTAPIPVTTQEQVRNDSSWPFSDKTTKVFTPNQSTPDTTPAPKPEVTQTPSTPVQQPESPANQPSDAQATAPETTQDGDKKL